MLFVLFVCSFSLSILFLVAVKKCAMPLSEPLVDHQEVKWFEEDHVSGVEGRNVTTVDSSKIISQDILQNINIHFSVN